MVDSDRIFPFLSLSPSRSSLTSSLAASTASRNLILASLGAAMALPVAPSYARARLVLPAPRTTTNVGCCCVAAEAVGLASPSEAVIAERERSKRDRDRERERGMARRKVLSGGRAGAAQDSRLRSSSLDARKQRREK